MRRLWKYLLALCLCLCLPSAALAEVTFIPQLENWNLDTLPIEVTLSADVTTHMPFDDTRTAQLNALLSHLSLRLNFQQLDQEAWSRVAVLVDGQEALSVAQRQMPDATLLQLSSITDRAFSYAAGQEVPSVLTELLGSDSTEVDLYGLDGTEAEWIEDGYTLLRTIGAALEEYKSETSVKTTIKNMGTARTKQVFTIPKAQADALAAAIAECCPEGKLRTLLTSLTFSGKQTLTLYRSESGMLLRADYSGSCGVDADHLRTVTLSWKMRRDDEAVRDTLSLKTPAASGTDRNTLSLERVLTYDKSGNVTLDTEFTYEWVESKQKTTLTGTIDLTNDLTETSSHVSGTVTIKRTLPGEDTASTIKLTPDLVIYGEDGLPSAIGSVLVQEYSGKNVVEQADISLSLDVGQYFDWELRSIIIDVDGLTETQAGIVAQEIAASAVTALIRPLVLLPKDDTLFLSADLPEDTWQKLVDAAQSALQ